MRENELLYTDETKLKDLTVGQLKDIILEVLNHGTFTRFEPEKRLYKYDVPYTTPNKAEPVYDPCRGPFC